MDSFQVYKEIKTRTNGEIYIGVVGPVRTGKSTFIKRCMELLVLPNLMEEPVKARTRDELPQSASGTTIMTTEPKFIPKEAAGVRLSEDVEVKIRMIDCVGYMVNGAQGHMEGEEERMVKTPWFDQEIPFTQAAAIGTQKVIREHSTLGVVVTTDGTIGELDRAAYVEAEARTIRELKEIGKPFVVLLNSMRPLSKETKDLGKKLEEKYMVPVIPVNCQQITEEEIHEIMRQILFEFPVSEVEFYLPKWVEMLPEDHKIKTNLLSKVREILNGITDIRSVRESMIRERGEFLESVKIEKIEMDTGKVQIRMEYAKECYYDVLSELTGLKIRGEADLVEAMKELAALKSEYGVLKDAFTDVKLKGYGVVSPKKEEIQLEEPVLIKQGNKFGVKIHAKAPSIHMIRADIENEIAPIVGSEQQAQDLIQYLKEAAEQPEGIWGTNIFGKSIETMVLDGMNYKIQRINDASQEKLQDTMKKIVNDSNGGLVCIII